MFVVIMQAFSGFSQNCTPNPQYTQSGVHPDTMLPACLWSPYEKTLTVVVPKDTVLNGQTVIIDLFKITGVLHLPQGITYTCTPPSSLIAGGTSGCLSLVGTPDTLQNTGLYPLALVGKWFFHNGTVWDSLADTLAMPPLWLTPKVVAQIMGITEPLCDSLNQGSAIVYGYGSNPPFYYLWDNGQVGTVGTQLNPGIHFVYVTDGIGCTIMKYVTIETKGVGPVSNMIDTDPTCFGSIDGSVQINMTNTSVPPFSYSWSTGDTTSLLSQLPAGNYIVAITDGLGCVSIYVETLTQPDPFIVTAAVYPQTPGLNDGYIIVETTGGSPPYEYSWNTGETSETLLNITAGDYTLYLTDEQGCTYDTTFTLSVAVSVTEPVFPDISLYPNPVRAGEAIQLYALENIPDIKFRLFSSDMKIVKFWQSEYYGTKLNIGIPPTLPPGMYFFEINIEHTKKFYKIFVYP